MNVIVIVLILSHFPGPWSWVIGIAGHSDGELGAILALAGTSSGGTSSGGNSMHGSVSAVREPWWRCIFFRALLEHDCAVPRFEDGKSEYVMVAVDPKRVGEDVRAKDIIDVVKHVATTTGQLAEVVNYNVREQQYVAVGHKQAMKLLDLVLESGRADPRQMREAKTLVKATWKGLLQQATLEHDRQGRLWEMDGSSNVTAQVPGVDTPFHSRLMSSLVPMLRAFYTAHLDESTLNTACDVLTDRLLPACCGGETFEPTPDFAASLLERTGSPVLAQLVQRPLTHAGAVNGTFELPKRWKATVLVEFLSYQNTLHVDFIRTQNVLLESSIARFVEIGPAPMLSKMMARSLLEYHDHPCHNGSAQSIFCTGDANDWHHLYQSATGSTTGYSDVHGIDTNSAVCSSANISTGPARITDRICAIIRCIIAHTFETELGKIELDVPLHTLCPDDSQSSQWVVLEADLAVEFGAIPLKTLASATVADVTHHIIATRRSTNTDHDHCLGSKWCEIFASHLNCGDNLTVEEARACLERHSNLSSTETDAVMFLAAMQARGIVDGYKCTRASWLANMFEAAYDSHLLPRAALFKYLKELPPIQRQEVIAGKVMHACIRVCGSRSLQTQLPLLAQGISSREATQISSLLQEYVGDQGHILPTLLFNFPTLEKITEFLDTVITGQHHTTTSSLAAGTSYITPNTARHAKCDIGVMAMSCRFPEGADGPEMFWNGLQAGTDYITQVPEDRWDVC